MNDNNYSTSAGYIGPQGAEETKEQFGEMKNGPGSFAGDGKEKQQFCWNCGAVLEPAFIACPICGAKIHKENVTQNDPDRDVGEAASGESEKTSTESDTDKTGEQTAGKKSNVLLIVLLALLMAAIVACSSILVYLHNDKLRTEQYNQAAANEAIELIDDLGDPSDVTLDSKNKISEIRTYYNELSKEQKDLVTNYQSLKDAEAAIADLENSKDKKQSDTGDTGSTGETGNTGNTGSTGDTGSTGNLGGTGDGYLGEYIVTTNSDDLLIRSGPGLDYPKVSAMPKGSVVEVYGEYNGWYYVYYYGTWGWSKAEYLTKW